jgi:K+-sensing histidine kinase KdpD
MKISMLVIAGPDEPFQAAAIDALKAAYPGAPAVRLGSLREALESEPAPSPQILVLAEADQSKIREAALAVDGQRLPRWAVVARSESGPIAFAEVVPEREWSAGLLSRVFRSSVALHMTHRERDRLRGDLLSVGIRICHDLRTPVGGILVNTEVVEASLPAPSPAEPSLTQPIVESANDLVKIIGQLSLVTKASARPESRQTFNMATPVGRALERIEMRVREKGATVTNPKSWPEAVGDPVSTESVWVALMDNAVRHSGKAPRIELGWEESADSVTCWVRDGGAGIPLEKRRSLFLPFHRLHEPNAPRGLGLSIVQRLVQLQGGQCGYKPGIPDGAVFFFSLPRTV